MSEDISDTEPLKEADSIVLELWIIRKEFENLNNLIFDLVEVLGHLLDLQRQSLGVLKEPHK